MLTIDHISKLPPDALLAVTQPDGSIHVYIPGDGLLPMPRPVAVPPLRVVSMRQARLALLGAGLLSKVDAAIAALPEPQRSAAKITWEYSTEVRSSDLLVSQLAAGLGLDDAALDALFDAAETL